MQLHVFYLQFAQITLSLNVGKQLSSQFRMSRVGLHTWTGSWRTCAIVALDDTTLTLAERQTIRRCDSSRDMQGKCDHASRRYKAIGQCGQKCMVVLLARW